MLSTKRRKSVCSRNELGRNVNVVHEMCLDETDPPRRAPRPVHDMSETWASAGVLAGVLVEDARFAGARPRSFPRTLSENKDVVDLREAACCSHGGGNT